MSKHARASYPVTIIQIVLSKHFASTDTTKNVLCIIYTLVWKCIVYESWKGHPSVECHIMFKVNKITVDGFYELII